MSRCVFLALVASALLVVALPAPAPVAAQDPAQPEQPEQPGDPPAMEADTVATITFAAGLNRVRRAGTGKLERAATDLQLKEGDTVRVSASGRVTLVYTPSGVYRSLSPGDEISISASQASNEQSADMAKVNEAMVSSLRSQKEGSLAAVGGTRDRRNPAEPFMISPRNTLLLPGATVVLRWEKPDGAPANLLYEVVVLQEGREILRERSANSVLELVPERIEKLEAGRLYYWYVVRADRPTVPAAKAMFRLLDAQRARQIRARMEANEQLAAGDDDMAPQFMNARLMYQESLFTGALDTWRKVYQAAPGDPGLISAIRSAYRAMGFFPDDIDRYVARLRTDSPEFTPATSLTAAAAGSGTVELNWTPTSHPDVASYRVTWWPATSAEPSEGEGQSRTVAHSATQTAISQSLDGLAPGRYLARVRSLGADGKPLHFDSPENLTVEFLAR